MKGLGMMMGMALMFSGAGSVMPMYADPGRAYAKRGPKRYKEYKDPRKEKSHEQKLNDFSLEIVRHNAEKGSEFKSWKIYDVRGVEIVSSNMKNAIKIFNRVMKENDLAETDF